LIQLYDITGKLLLSKKSNEQKQHSLEIPQLAMGTYFVQIVDSEGGQQTTQKLVVID